VAGAGCRTWPYRASWLPSRCGSLPAGSEERPNWFRRAAVRAGATGYLLKGAAAADSARAIRAVAGGGSALEPRLAATLVAAVRAPRGAGPLTGREREVLTLIAAGLLSKQVAQALGISERTVTFHTSALLRKLGADTRAQAVALAAQRGLLDSSLGR
jgi:DNA-binding NarL/FixJ family response regulator